MNNFAERKKNWSLALFVSWKVVFRKSLFKLLFVCLSLEKLVNEKHSLVKEKFGLISRKMFFFYFERKTLSRSCEKFRNVMLIADYIEFSFQTFDCYILCFESLFYQLHPLEIWFNLIFISTLVLIFIIIICFSLIIFLIEIFYLSDLVIILLIVIYFI